jgi:hypothetical protein
MRVTKSWRMNEAVHVACMGMKENTYRVLMAEKLEGNSPLGGPRHR